MQGTDRECVAAAAVEDVCLATGDGLDAQEFCGCVRGVCVDVNACSFVFRIWAVFRIWTHAGYVRVSIPMLWFGLLTVFPSCGLAC